jgi:hypothetical protein
MLFDETNWAAYREANLQFSYAVAQVCKSGDIVWVQDYHRKSALEAVLTRLKSLKSCCFPKCYDWL